MEEIKNYINRFFSKKKQNKKYALLSDDVTVFAYKIFCEDDAFETIKMLFDYGYVKGCRACKAEQKKAKKAA